MKKFKRIYIEITNICNLKCSFCPTSKRKQEYMSLQSFEKILKSIKGYGEYVYLHIKGEPLIHPQFKEILFLCQQYNLKVNITTNGTLLEKQMTAILTCKAVRQVSVSLQSFENICDQKAFEIYMNQVLEIVNRARKETQIIFELRLWNYEDQEHALEDFDKNKIALEMIKQSLNVKGHIFEQIQKGKGIKLLPQVYLSKAYEFQWPDMSRDILHTKGKCYGLRQQVGILVNGDVVPCCLDSEGDIVLGNIFESTVEDIVTDTRAVDMVEGFERNQLVEDLCQRCGYRERFDKA